jgi:hypothetical protein
MNAYHQSMRCWHRREDTDRHEAERERSVCVPRRGNTLSLTQLRNARGMTVQNAATTRLMRVDVPVFVILSRKSKIARL